MMRKIGNVAVVALALGGVFALASCSEAGAKKGSNPHVVFETSLGTVELELFADKAPLTAKNILAYVDDGFYNDVICHRVIPGFVVQCGGFTAEMQKKDVKSPVKNEATNGLKNKRGTLSMARTSIVDSATSQFFINLVDNTRLDHTDTSASGYGYAVFGKVVKGMDIVDAMAKQPTCPRAGPQVCTKRLPMGMRDVPATPIVIKKATRK